MKKEITKLATQISSLANTNEIESALCHVSENGDVALLQVVQETDSSTIAKLLCDHDDSKTSISHYIIDAMVLIKVLKHFPALIQAGRDPLDISKMWCGALTGSLEGLSDEQKKIFYDLIYEDSFAREILMYAMAGKSSEFDNLQKITDEFCPAADILLEDMEATDEYMDRSQWLGEIISQAKNQAISIATTEVTEDIFEPL